MIDLTTRRSALARALASGCTLALGLPFAPARAADDGWLVTPEEAAAQAGLAPPPLLGARTPGAPRVEVLRPRLDTGALATPLPIELVFVAAAGAAIDPQSFRVLYGAFEIDITKRLLKTVAVTPAGLKVEQAAIPAGSHRLLLQIADDHGRVGSRELRFTVA